MFAHCIIHEMAERILVPALVAVLAVGIVLAIGWIKTNLNRSLNRKENKCPATRSKPTK